MLESHFIAILLLKIWQNFIEKLCRLNSNLVFILPIPTSAPLNSQLLTFHISLNKNLSNLIKC